MEYQSIDGLGELASFVAIVDAGGFTAAARATRGRKATLSKRLQALEARLGVPLLVRTTRSIRLTEEGEAYLEHGRRALAAARDADAAVSAARAEPRGLLRVSISASLAAFAVDAVFASYLLRYPNVALHVDTSERMVDVIREGYDVVVRAGPLESSTLVARKLGVGTGGFYASPRYLARRGEPKRPRDLIAHDTIAVPKAGRTSEWPIVSKGRTQWIAIRPRLVVTDLEIAVRAAAAGLGVVRAPRQVAQPYLKARTLVQVLTSYTPPALDVHAVFPPGGSRVPKTRAFLDLLQAWFRDPERTARGR